MHGIGNFDGFTLLEIAAAFICDEWWWNKLDKIQSKVGFVCVLVRRNSIPLVRDHGLLLLKLKISLGATASLAIG